ncbi:hypothetical protein [Mycobacteroides abscessus]|uniref:hypothetical protein n=1 Tax=Mycobacteroides abscessus TaxID=36809 RepID=UPI0010427E69|nr:hypothetical protein [Mycobacteroides abscessus]
MIDDETSSEASCAEMYTFTVAASAPLQALRTALWPEKRRIPDWASEETSRTSLISQRRAEGHTMRMQTAGHLHRGHIALDPARCKFGDRRLTLTGTIASDTPEQATATVFELLRWTLERVYGAEPDHRRRVVLSGVDITLRNARNKNTPQEPKPVHNA